MIEPESLAQFPCLRNCCLDDEDICLGCFRSQEEIMQWGRADDRQRAIIQHNARQRRTAHELRLQASNEN